jgi:hypothetical protein
MRTVPFYNAIPRHKFGTMANMDFLKTVGGKIVGGLVAVAVIAVVIVFWQMDARTRSSIFTGTGNVVAWFAIVAMWPWVSFAIIRWVNGFHSNLAGGLLVIGYTSAELALLVWLFGWPGSATGWTFTGVGILLAAAYNVFACDWIAEKLE